MSGDEYKDVWVFSEVAQISFELLGKARALADTLRCKAVALNLGPDSATASRDYISCGADVVMAVNNPLLKGFRSEPYTDAVAELVNTHKPSVILMGATKNGLELAPRIAERLKTGCCTECVRIEPDADKRFVLMDRLVFGGNVVETQIVKAKPQMATVAKGIFQSLTPDPSRKGEVIQAEPKINEPSVTVLERKTREAATVKITDADVIVSFGRGIRKKEDANIIQNLAKVIGGVVGCSRPIAEDLKWLPVDQYIGLSGQKVSPKLYLACGISGQIQHITGIRNSRIIVAINSDPKAPIFEFADYSAVGDLYQIVPALTEAIQRLSSK